MLPTVSATKSTRKLIDAEILIHTYTEYIQILDMWRCGTFKKRNDTNAHAGRINSCTHKYPSDPIHAC